MAFPATYNFNYYWGDTFEFLIYPKDSNGGVFSLDGYNARFAIAESRGGEPVLDSNTIPNTPLTAEILENSSFIRCEIKSEYGKLLTGNSYIYDVQITKPAANKVYTIATGTITITKDVTP